MAANGTDSLNEDTVASYIKALKKIIVIEDMVAWCPNLRNKAVIRTSETRYFVDSSIAVAALGVGPEDLMNDLNTFGLFFETMAVRDLRCYVESMDGTLYHYHDGSGLECDAVLHLRNGRYGLVEIKLGGERLKRKAHVFLESLPGKSTRRECRRHRSRWCLSRLATLPIDGTPMVLLCVQSVVYAHSLRQC